ncbi:MAG: hypothetical protein R2847_13215 [Bacteroidia bacterium]
MSSGFWGHSTQIHPVSTHPVVCLNAFSGPWADPGFDSHVREFLTLNYQAPAHLMEDAFQALQHDLLQGRVLITERMTRFPAFFWIPPKEDQAGYWLLGHHVHAEHRPILQLALDNARADVPNASVDGATESQSALGRAFDTAKGAAKQFANDLMRRNAALNAQWQAENGMATFTDKATGNVLSPDEVKERWEAEGKDVLPIEGEDQQQGAQAVKDAPAMGAAMVVAQTAASRGRNIIQQPDDITQDIAKALQSLRGPKDKQLSEALGKIGGEQAKRRQGVKTDPRYVDRYHGPDDMTRDSNDKLGEWEFKGNKADSKAVAKDSNGHKQGSEKKNETRARKMTKDKARKVDSPSNRQGGPYTQEEIALWQEVEKNKGQKQHFSVHTNTETGMVRTYERNDVEEPKLIDEFRMDNFDEIKKSLQELLK